MIELNKISKRLGDFQMKEVCLKVNAGEYFVMLGPSGAGKTVLLEVIAGLVTPDRGRILYNGEDITGQPPEVRRFALAYQDYALFPHMSARDNIAYGPRHAGVGKSDARGIAEEQAAKIGVTHLLDRNPATLSGGESQRVALARVLAAKPRVVLLDEPLAAVDPTQRDRLRILLREVQRETGTTFVHVTHDTAEAMYLGSRIGVIMNGELRQVDPPQKLFATPKDRDVAEFLGLRNVFGLEEAHLGRCIIEGVSLVVAGCDDSDEYCWIRPEDILLSHETFESSARNQFPCRVVSFDPDGLLMEVKVAVDRLTLSVMITKSSFEELQISDRPELYCTFKSSAIHCF